jgi:hypothetical protein
MLVEPPNSAARIQPILVEVVRNGERDRPPKIWYRMEMITNHPRTASGNVPQPPGRTNSSASVISTLLHVISIGKCHRRLSELTHTQQTAESV